MNEDESLAAISSNLLRTSETLAIYGEQGQPVIKMFLEQARVLRENVANPTALEVLDVLDLRKPEAESLLTAALLVQNCRHHWYKET